MLLLNRVNRLFKLFLLLIDVLLFCSLYSLLSRIYNFDSPASRAVATSVFTYWKIGAFYLVGAVRGHISLKEDIFSIVNILRNSLINISTLAILLLLSFAHDTVLYPFFLIFLFCCLVVLIVTRILERKITLFLRSFTYLEDKILLVGSNSDLVEIRRNMEMSMSHKYKILGYFDRNSNCENQMSLPYLGGLDATIDYIDSHPVDAVYCALPMQEKELIRNIVTHCENRFVYFFSVPDFHNLLTNQTSLKLFGDVPVLALHKDPLAASDMRFLKRAFDLVSSFVFLVTIFPIIYVVVAIIIKITSPGPVFFKQERTGYQGHNFKVYKFRSMKVNKDSDTVQATKDDPRKTKFGEFLRKSNIDELPQMINVLKGEMSLVGPRPHMLKHTEQYSALIGKYMVRHFVKPGITGWAQVKGCRGETKNLIDMERRVQADIWYLDHWSIWLDFYIIFKTIKNAIKGDEQAY